MLVGLGVGFTVLIIAEACGLGDRAARYTGAIAGMLVTGTLQYLNHRAEGLKQERRDAGRCVACAYDLTGNVSGVCPECGSRR